MKEMVQHLWLVPVLPLLAAGLTAFLKRGHRRLSAGLAIGAMTVAFLLSCRALVLVVAEQVADGPARAWFKFPWLELGSGWLELGWVLDPLSASMLTMITFVGLLIFVYSLGYMAADRNFTRFFCFLSLFAAAMLGLVIANSLLLLFICWELVGLTSYLLIGFWFQKPSAAAAARKAFIVTRIGDLAFFLGMVWLYSETGTLLFYDGGKGCLEPGALDLLVNRSTVLGLTVCGGIGLLLFVGAVGKSGQVPLHVWLPDAMEGPTPVSALIHAATMVAAGVFLVARVYPLMSMTAEPVRPTVEFAAGAGARLPSSPALQAGQPLQTQAERPSPEPQRPSNPVLITVTWVGVLTALLAATMAVAQTDIKRILAYSTVSQLGFMMLGLGTGGVAVGIFHLIAHAFFKALLFLGAGSAIHGCHEEQDIRRMGGLRRFMPLTFATYAVGMMALSGVPLFFSGFWSKDEILHAAHAWPVSTVPFYLGVAGAFLTAFYMTRQVVLVFFGERAGSHDALPHESPAVMTVPLAVLAALAVFFGFLGTPAWPWFQGFVEGRAVVFDPSRLVSPGIIGLMVVSSLVVSAGIAVGLWVYARRARIMAPDPLQTWRPDLFSLFQHQYWIDEAYDLTFVRLTRWFGTVCARLDHVVWDGFARLAGWLVLGVAWVSRLFDEYCVNGGFDRGCRGLKRGGGWLSWAQNGLVQHYLRALGLALVVLILLSLWGCGAT